MDVYISSKAASLSNAHDKVFMFDSWMYRKHVKACNNVVIKNLFHPQNLNLKEQIF